MHNTVMQKQITDIWKTMKKIKNHHILCIQVQIVYMHGQCLKNYKSMVLNLM